MNSLSDQLSFSDTRPAKENETTTQGNNSVSASALNTSASKKDGVSRTKDFRLQERTTMFSIMSLFRIIHRWWLQRAERHYLICADVEEQRAREAQMNVAYYQKRAALVRSALHY